MLANLRFRERTLVLLAVTTGLRRSEIFALKWKDVDSEAKQIHITRSIVQHVVASARRKVPRNLFPPTMIWWRRCSNGVVRQVQIARRLAIRESCASRSLAYLAQQIMRHHILPVARKLGINKRIGWHTFRHTYSTLRRSTGADLKIMQEVLRHSTIRVTLDTQSLQRSAVRRKLLSRSWAHEKSRNHEE